MSDLAVWRRRAAPGRDWERRDGTYRPIPMGWQEWCQGWGPARGEPDHHACRDNDRAAPRLSRWMRDGRSYCGTCKRADEAWRVGSTVDHTGRDPQLRAALEVWLGVDGRRVRVRHEVEVRIGAPIRIDVLAVTGDDPMAAPRPGLLEAFEIKSDADSLARLPRQIAGYDLVAQRCWLVTGPKHHAKATALLPPYWGVLRLDGDHLVLDRPAADNPNLSVLALLNLVVDVGTLRRMAKAMDPNLRSLRGMYVHELRAHIAQHADADPPWLLAAVRSEIVPTSARG